MGNEQILQVYLPVFLLPPSLAAVKKKGCYPSSEPFQGALAWVDLDSFCIDETSIPGDMVNAGCSQKYHDSLRTVASFQNKVDNPMSLRPQPLNPSITVH